MLRIVILGIAPYPKPPGLPAHFILRHPNGALYPKPFKSKLRLLLALGKATAEEVGEADSPEGFGLIQWQGQTFKRS